MLKLGLAVVTVLAIGCGDDGGVAAVDAAQIDARVIDASIDTMADAAPLGTPLTFSGTIAPGGSVTTGVTAVIWIVTSGSPDYAYKFGDGTGSGTTFMVTVGGTPPAQAINSYGIGVGIVALFPAGTVIPDGIVTNSQLSGISITDQYSIIYRAASASTTLVPWIAPFPEGLSCGKCKAATSGGFDTFEPTACTTVQIVHGQANVCNWT